MTTSKDTSNVSFKEAVCGPQYRRATWIGVGVFSFQQLTGISGVVPYTSRLLVSMAESSNGEFPISPLVGALIMGFMQAFGALFAYIPIRFFGRKSILMFGQLTMALSFGVAGLGLVMKWYITAFVCLLLFIFFF